MDFKADKENLTRQIKNVSNYLVFFVLFGLLGTLYNNFFFTGNDIVSAVLTIMPILVLGFSFYLFILLFIYTIGVFGSIGK
jgi:ACR3 family arsenite efflux pump ArsB